MNEQKNRRKKKMGKVQREKLRAVKADEFNNAFTMGYNAGYGQALKDLAKENEK
jgi:hypothetical protein